MKQLVKPLGIAILSCLLAGMVEAQRVITPEDLYQLTRASDPRISPDGNLVAYVVTRPDQDHSKWHSEIWLAATDGSQEPRRLTDAIESSSRPRWCPDGHALAFVSSRPSTREKTGSESTPDRAQVYLLSLNGGEARQITSFHNGVSDFSWSPDGTRLAVVSKIGPRDVSGPGERSDTRHYVHPTFTVDGRGFLDDRREHIWVVTIATGVSQEITNGDDWDDTDPRWSPDSTQIAFYSDRGGRYWEDISNSAADVWAVSVGGGNAVLIAKHATKAGGPLWSSDGKAIAYLEAEREDGPRKIVLAPISPTTKTKELASDLDVSARDLMWANNGHDLYFLANERGEAHLFCLDVASARLSRITSGARFVRQADVNPATGLVYTAGDDRHPPDLYSLRLDGSGETQLGHSNDIFLRTLTLPPVERFSYKVDDGLQVDAFLIKPASFDTTKKYPLILYVHGGPESMFGMDWMMLPQVLAARGWWVLYINPRGSSGYGSKFVEAVVKEWGGKVYTDLMAGVDAALARNPSIDAERLGVMGCSFGGYMTNWIVSHTGRFKAAVPMCSISNYVSDEGTRDDYYGHAYDFGGDLYQNFDLYWKYSPIRYAMNVKTPTLILHGEQDYRVPLEQAEQWLRALHHFHVTSELVVFPREAHSGLLIGEPKHVVETMQWQIYWFERYLNNNAAARAPDAPSPIQNPVVETK
jgi:dipeptidyl aminopeptidase/acylaminoacyl peptidase